MNKSIFKAGTSLIMATAIVFSMAAPVSASMQDADPPRTAKTEATAAVTQKKGFETSTKYKYSSIKKKIATHQETNKQVKAWLVIPGTNINEPITYTSKDNYYYMYRDWAGKEYPIDYKNYMNYPNTVTYADFRTKFGDTWKDTSRNIVLYGHNWSNLRTPLDIGNKAKHQMFAQLPSYTDINFAKENPYIYFSTGKNEGVWKVFSVAYCELKESFNYNSPMTKKADFEKLLKEWDDRTMFDFDVDVTTDDRILTLSTCTRQYNQGSKQRFVVVARLLRDGESENDPVKVTVNKDMKQPQF